MATAASPLGFMTRRFRLVLPLRDFGGRGETLPGLSRRAYRRWTSCNSSSAPLISAERISLGVLEDHRAWISARIC